MCGGDPLAAGEVMARQRVWVDSFAIRRYPVTNAELLVMVNALVDQRDPRAEELALSVVPRHRGTATGEAGTLVWPRDANGHFALGSDDEGLAWEPHVPAFMVNWHSAVAYAAWLGQRTGRPYRLPGELEYEKAARGVDARAFPWGDFFDPSWACMRLSQPSGCDPLPSKNSRTTRVRMARAGSRVTSSSGAPTSIGAKARRSRMACTSRRRRPRR